MRFPHWRGSTLVALGGVLLLVAAPPAHHSAAATRLQVQAVQDTWQPRWAPQASLDGLVAHLETSIGIGVTFEAPPRDFLIPATKSATRPGISSRGREHIVRRY